MKHSNLKVGMPVRVKIDSSFNGCDFYARHDGTNGVVVVVDHAGGDMSVQVRFDNDDYDWGNHRSLISLEENDIDNATIYDKLSQIDKLVKEIKEML